MKYLRNIRSIITCIIFNSSFDETVRRHETRKLEKGSEFGGDDMREWYSDAHHSNHVFERIIPEAYSLGDTVQHIISETKL